MQRTNPGIFLYIIAILWLSACTKKEKVEDPIPETKQSDQSGSAAVDGAMEDVNDYISNNIGGGSGKGQRTAAYDLPCGVIAVDTTFRSYTLKYGRETPCGYKRKSGQVKFSLVSGTKFSDSSAVFSVTFTNYMVEILATNDVVKVNGTLYTTNINGGHIWQSVTEGKTISHRWRGALSITYSNNQVRTRKYFHVRTWTSNKSWATLKFTVSGDTSITRSQATYDHVSETGRTYDNDQEYYTQISDPFIWSYCSGNTLGAYVLQRGKARMNVESPVVSPAYFEVQAGYKYNVSNPTSAIEVHDCTSNAYKIEIRIGTTTSTQYQLY
jgi:hypothetical protein